MKHKRSTKRTTTEQVESSKRATKEPLINCPKCDKKFLDSSGLAGHLRLTHGIRVGPKEELRQLKSKLESVLRNPVDHKECISKKQILKCPKCKQASWAYEMVEVASGQPS